MKLEMNLKRPILKLWNHRVINLKKAYALVQDIDTPKLRCRSQDHWASAFKSSSSQYPRRVSSHSSKHKVEIKSKSVENNSNGKNTESDFSTFSLIIKCCYCQG